MSEGGEAPGTTKRIRLPDQDPEIIREQLNKEGLGGSGSEEFTTNLVMPLPVRKDVAIEGAQRRTKKHSPITSGRKI